MIEQFLYFLLLSKIDKPVVKGHVYNVGLGDGKTARLLLESRLVNTVVSLEKSQAAVDAYRLRYPATETLEDAKHTMGQFIIGVDSTIFIDPPIDLMYINVIDNYDVLTFTRLKSWITDWSAPGKIALTGGMIIEWHDGDSAPERDLKDWLVNTGWTPNLVRPRLASANEKVGGRAAEMVLYQL